MFTQIARLRTRRRVFTTLITVTLLLSVTLTLSVTKDYPQEDGNSVSGLDVDKLALSFEPNEGQASAPARFIARAPGSTIYFSPSDVAIEVKSIVVGPGASTPDDKDTARAEYTLERSEGLIPGSKF